MQTKVILGLLFIVFMSSCLGPKIDDEQNKETYQGETIVTNTGELSTMQSDSVDQEEWTPEEPVEDIVEIFKNISNKEEFYASLGVNKDFQYNTDLLLYEKILQNDKEYFQKNPEEVEFFKIFRNFLYNDYISEDVESLKLCLKGEGQTENQEYLKICLGDDNYIESSDTNYAHTKTTLSTLLQVKSTKNINDCSALLNGKYSVGGNYAGVVSDYLFCKKFVDDSTALFDEYYYFFTATEYNFCSYLEDKNLINFCNAIKDDFKNT